MLPDKTIKTTYSLIGIGALLLSKASTQETVSSLWEKVKKEEPTNTYDKFIKGLVFLFSIKAIEYHNGIIRVGIKNAH